jgi:hypothetical protein
MRLPALGFAISIKSFSRARLISSRRLLGFSASTKALIHPLSFAIS